MVFRAYLVGRKAEGWTRVEGKWKKDFHVVVFSRVEKLKGEGDGCLYHGFRSSLIFFSDRSQPFVFHEC